MKYSHADVLRMVDETLRDQPGNIGRICRLGRALVDLRDWKNADRCLSQALGALRACLERGDANVALAIELELYESFVKAIETEEHYARCFALWSTGMTRMGESFAIPASQSDLQPRGSRIAFVLVAGTLLGHTEVLFRYLEADAEIARQSTLLVLSDSDPNFRERALKSGAKLVEVGPNLPDGSGHADQLRWAQSWFAGGGADIAVWVSTPVLAHFAFAMRLAPRQVYWALRFHPFRSQHCDAYITYGAWSEARQEFHGQAWQVCPVPLALDRRKFADAELAEVRACYPTDCLLGTLAREEKIASTTFLDALVRILQERPNTRYLWTGRTQHTQIQRRLEEGGVADRCHFIGWVDTALHAAALDVFLETFPLGCGVTGYQALAAGVPVLSILEKDTLFGMSHWHEFAGRPKPDTIELERYPLLCAADSSDYVRLAKRLIDDPVFRRLAGSRGLAQYEQEFSNTQRYARRFFETIIGRATRTDNP